jgi:acyl carrier protein
VRESRAAGPRIRAEINDHVLDIEAVRSFVRREFLFDADAQLADDDPLFPDVIDSLGVMELVDFIEREYRITVEEDELLVDNFRSLSAIASLVDRKSDAA